MLHKLKILEAVENEIKLKLVPDGATAEIPHIPNIEKGDIVRLFVVDVFVAEQLLIGDEKFPIHLKVSRRMLLNFVERSADFTYRVDREGDVRISPPATYRISDS
ncbi:hypothetical protein [Pseudomonas sp. RT6P73]